MSAPERNAAHLPSRSLRDLAWVAAVTLACALLAARYQWSERLFNWTRRLESFQLDELTFVLLTLALGLAWFAARRWHGARCELRARLVAQSQLARALDEQQRLGRQFVALQERERKRLSRELHDEMGQFINAIKLDAVAIRTRLSQATTTPAAQVAEQAQSIIANADLVHASVARLIRQLRPVGLDELGLAAAIEHCVDTWRERLAPAEVSLQLDERIDTLDEAVTLVVYRTVQEALTNCARHSAAGRIEVRIDFESGAGCEQAVIRVADDGVGCDPRGDSAGLGLVGMRERLQALGGSLQIDTAAGRGFRLTARLPGTSDS